MIRLKEVVINILDKNTGNLICSQKSSDLTDGLLQDYLGKIIKKFENSEGKDGEIEDTHPLVSSFTHPTSTFVEAAEKLSSEWFSIIATAEDVCGGDVVFFKGENDTEDQLLGIFKLNHTTKYTHFVEADEDGVVNKIILNQAILPSPSQKIEEGIILNVTKHTYHLLEKKYKIDGERVEYFSKLFLKIATNKPVSEEIKTIKKAVNKVAEKYNTEKFVKLSTTQEAIYDTIDQTGEIDPTYIAEAVFQENIAAKEEYLEVVKEKGLPEKIPVVNPQRYEKKYSKQKFKLNNGIELAIPIEVYKNKEMVEFVNNPDGTISVIIKNIEEVLNKFS